MNIKRIIHYYWMVLRQYKTAFFAVPFFASARMVLFSIASGLIYKNIIDTLSNSNFSIDDRFSISLDLVFILGVCFLAAMIISRWGDYVYFRMLTKVEKKLFDFSFEKINNHSYSFFANNFTGSLVTKMKRFTNSFNSIVDPILYSFIPTFLMIVLSFVILFRESRFLAFYFIIFSFIFFFLTFFFARQKIKLDLESAKTESLLTGSLSDNLTNILNLKIFSSFYKEKEYFGNVTENYRSAVFKSVKFHVIRNGFNALLMVVFHIIVLFTMVRLWRIGEITLGSFMLVYTYMQAIFDRMWDISHGFTRFMKSLTDAKEGVDIFDQNPDVVDIENPETLKEGEGEIEFKNVSFEYVSGRDVFKDFNLNIKPKEKVGLVGHSGSGKSTITKILLRFINLKDGEILLDGQNIAKIKQDDLRSKISYVPQEAILFHRSIKENIGYSKPDASMEEIIEAAKKAYAHDFIINLPNGYDTLVGERGVKLSGGERQRVAIARAMLKNAPILVLDEATSALDSISEHYIQEAFKELMKGKTTIVIAHRLSTIQKMDRIILLEEGEIVEEGNHEVLLSKNGKYKELWDHQTGGYLLE